MFLEHPEHDPELMIIFPMAKASMNIMKAVNDFGSQNGLIEPDAGHVMMGASKRGWTAWMVGAAHGAAPDYPPI